MYTTMTYDRHRDIRDRAERMFERMWFKGRVRALWAQLTGANQNLLFLSDVSAEPVSIEKLERTPVDLDMIQGTEGRNDRFDNAFNPISRRMRNRWVGVASAIMDDITQIPPIEVIQVGDVYYVSDGHHRVSASKALGKISIDANIIRWHMADEAPSPH